MAYRPPAVQPDFEKLRTIISATKTAVADRALNQVLTQLLDQLKQFQSITKGGISGLTDDVEDINVSLNELIDDLQNVTFLTVNDETGNFPDSVQLLPGTNITFDDTVPNERTINATGGGGSSDHPVGTVYETWVNINAGTLLGYGVWELMATGIKSPTADITFTVY